MAHADDRIRQDLIAEGPRPPRAIGELVNDVKTDVLALVKSEIDLAKTELVPQVKSGGVGVGLFLASAYFAMNAVSLLFLSGALALGMLFDADTGPVALGFLIMAVIVFIVTGILALAGRSFVKRVKGPERTKAQAAASIDTIKEAVTRATAEVKTQELERKAFRYPDVHGRSELR